MFSGFVIIRPFLPAPTLFQFIERQGMDHSLNTLLNRVTVSLSAFLERILPSLFEDWWNQSVVNNLSFQQRRRMEQRGIASLGDLDLAALLRVLDQNWYQISNKLGLTSESRHFVKEMQTIRNRCGHTRPLKASLLMIYIATWTHSSVLPWSSRQMTH